MEVGFVNRKIRKSIHSEKLLRQQFGPRMPKRVKERLKLPATANNLEEITFPPPYRRHRLTTPDNHYAINLDQQYRLVFIAHPPPDAERNNCPPSEITSITILEIVDYHQCENHMTARMPTYEPDHDLPPGSLIESYMEEEAMSLEEFSRCSDCSPELISGIVTGRTTIDPGTAVRLERVLHVKAELWLRMDADHQLHRFMKSEEKSISRDKEWAESFPINEMVKRGCFPRPESTFQLVSNLLVFFQVGSVSAWKKQPHHSDAAFRHSPSFESDKHALAAWLQMGRIEVEDQCCADYNDADFRDALIRIRKLTREPVSRVMDTATGMCNAAGVALALIPPFKKTATSGATRWISPGKAIIQLSARHKTDDHFWFSFFHEGAHVLLHKADPILVDMDKGMPNDSGREREANEWAADTLVPRRDWKRFTAAASLTSKEIESFARTQGISPGIVVGMLQHEKFLPWRTSLNRLKRKVDLSDTN